MYDEKKLGMFLETMKTLVGEAKKEFPTFEFALVPAPGYMYIELHVITDPEWGYYHDEYGLMANDNGVYKRLNDIFRFDKRMLDLNYKTNCMRYNPKQLAMEYFVFS